MPTKRCKVSSPNVTKGLITKEKKSNVARIGRKGGKVNKLTVQPRLLSEPKQSKTKAQIGRMSRNKGAGGEREALAWLRKIFEPVYIENNVEPTTIERNLQQVIGGGCDLKGVTWLAIEVKRRETIDVKGWWSQTVRQMKPGEIPFLMWRVSRQPWRFRVRMPVKIGPLHHALDVDLDEEQAALWLAYQLRARILAERRGTLDEWGLTSNT